MSNPAAYALALAILAERAFVAARLGWVCIICRTLFVGEPRVGFVTCARYYSDLNQRSK